MRILRHVTAWTLGVLGFLILALPVALLPLSTAIPAWFWVPLAVADLAGAVWLVRARRPAARAAGVAAVVGVAVVAVVASQVFAATPPIVDEAGRPVPASVASLEQVTLNGSQQWITIRGHDADNPVLLNLGMGGPGGGGFATRSQFQALERHFTVVSWDEPGTGKSIAAVPLGELDRDRFVEDARALAELLLERFDEERLFVYGVSWSSILGIWLVQDYPHLFHAFVSSGQMVNTTENDRLGYDYAVRYARERGDQRTVDRLLANGPPPYGGTSPVWKYLDYLDVLNDSMGAPRYAWIVPLVPFLAPEYGLVDKVNHTRGLIDSFNAVYPKLADLDLTEQAARLEVPVYFLVGRDDVNAMASLVERYHQRLSAPHKELIWLEGGHGLGSADPAPFVDFMVNDLRPLATKP